LSKIITPIESVFARINPDRAGIIAAAAGFGKGRDSE
jgi:hypothetical protein